MSEETRDYTKFNKGLLFGLVIVAAALFAAFLWLNDTVGENVELKRDLEKKDLIIGKQWETINQDNKDMEDLRDYIVTLRMSLAKSNREKEKLSRENGFLFPWGNSVTDKLESTIDYRPLTVLRCDNIARWLLKKAKEFRAFHEGR